MKKIFTTFIMVAIGVITSFAQVYTVYITPNNPELGEVEIGKLLGVFSVSGTKQVKFSQGNLQYQASTNTWRFAENQWDYVGSGNENISSTYSGWIDLFGWGTSGWNSGAKAYQPYSTSTTNSHYYPGKSATTNLTGTYANADWGVYNAISYGGNQKGLWRTLTKDEWNYLFNSRTNYNKLWSFATVNGIKGVVLLPDSWSLPSGLTFTAASEDYGTNVYTVAQWAQMEIAGAVFLPAAGRRYGTSVNGVGMYGVYWSSTYYSSDEACSVAFSSGNLNPSNIYYRSDGRSVRLCTDF